MDELVQIAQNTEGVSRVINKLKLRKGNKPVNPATSAALAKNRRRAALPVEKLMKKINGALSQAKLQGGGSRTQIVAKNTGWNVIVMSGAAEHQQQVNSAMQIARHAAAGNVQIKNDITVLGN